MLNVTLLATGVLGIAVDNVPWISGGDTAVRHHREWYTSDCNNRNSTSTRTIICSPLSLSPASSTTARDGDDVFGHYTATTLAWKGTKGTEPAIMFETAVRRCVAETRGVVWQSRVEI